ncbi:MAG: APC family permease [candidate division Zixibacteria bacterium]|nr:APC family permease [candidate division Zixibacteria bacterium]
MENKPTFIQKLKTLFIGGSRSLNDPGLFHKISLIAFFAWVGLGADGITSSCYGPQEAFLTLGGHHYLAIFVALGTAITIFVITASYSQIVELFPSGGGGYLVASKLLSPNLGMLSGCALLIDYVLTITVSVASGADALFSFLPPEWYSFRLGFAALVVVVLILLNLRGVKESVLPLVPIFLTFMLTHAFAIIYGLVVNLNNISTAVQATASEVHSVQYEIGFFGMLFLIMRAYSMGAGTFTGIEAVSNGLPILREPIVQTAKRTMRYMAFSLAFIVLGLMIGYLLYRVEFAPGKTLNAVLFQKMTTNWGDAGYVFVLVTLLSEAVLLFVAAQTGFLDGPRVLGNMALDRWFPTRFATLSDRLVTQNGILLMGGAATILMLLTGGSVKFLVVLYSINVFITFFLSQLGMVRHWWNDRTNVKGWKKKLSVNGIGLVLTGFILVSVVVLKFHQGGWITLLVTGSLVTIAVIIKRHYIYNVRLLGRLDELVVATSSPAAKEEMTKAPQFDPKAKTAVLLVNGFNGLGLHTLFSIIRLFGATYRNFVFFQVGTVDAGNFKGKAEIGSLENYIKSELDRYVDFVKRKGFYAEGVYSIGTEVVDEIAKIAPKILERFPNAVFFGGQLVFPKDTLLSRWLHNYTAFAVQRKLYHEGIPVVILPIRV